MLAVVGVVLGGGCALGPGQVDRDEALLAAVVEVVQRLAHADRVETVSNLRRSVTNPRRKGTPNRMRVGISGTTDSTGWRISPDSPFGCTPA
jgi:hypothetical protein